MQGRIKRRQALAAVIPREHGNDAPVTCPLCDRAIPPSERDAHHLIPKSRGGTVTVLLHRICHRQVHALFTEAELERGFHRIDALRDHPAMVQFLDWVRRKPDDFFERTRKSQRLRRR